LETHGDDALASLPNYSKQEIAFLVELEKAVRLDDVLLRRTSLAFAGELSQERVIEIAEVVARTLNWSPTRKEREISRAWELLALKHGVVPMNEEAAVVGN
jgi:glycerol-3-phosphate dehydrogenase